MLPDQTVHCHAMNFLRGDVKIHFTSASDSGRMKDRIKDTLNREGEMKHGSRTNMMKAQAGSILFVILSCITIASSAGLAIYGQINGVRLEKEKNKYMQKVEVLSAEMKQLKKDLDVTAPEGKTAAIRESVEKPETGSSRLREDKNIEQRKQQERLSNTGATSTGFLFRLQNTHGHRHHGVIIDPNRGASQLINSRTLNSTLEARRYRTRRR